MKKKDKIFLISSSTGGHALPVYHIYENLSSDFELRVFHSGSKLEKEIFKNCSVSKIVAGKIKRYNLWSSFFEIMKTIIGFCQALIFLLFSRPKVIISKGGFCSVPVLSAANFLRIPYILHESDSVMGISNKIFAKRATRVFVGFPESFYPETDQNKIEYCGQIIHFDEIKKSKYDRPVIYITGGSLGARSINDVVLKMIVQLTQKYFIVHSTGVENYEKINEYRLKLDEKQKKNYRIFDFSTTESRKSLIDADLIIARAGATTIGEIAFLSKASILIPYKYAAGDHQIKNAKYMEKSGGAIMIKEENFDAASLGERINFVFSDQRNAAVIGKLAHDILKTDGLETITTYTRRKYL